MADYFVPVRTSNDIALYLSSKQPTPRVPFELQGSISPDVWATRLPTIARVSERYSKPILERVWLFVGLIATFVVPLAVYSTILSALHVTRDDRLSISAAGFAEARAITGAISIGIILLFTVPMLVWKLLGRKQVNGMLQRWANSDRATIGNNNPIPTWRVKTPGVWSDNTVLTITLPPSYSPTSFHPNAYLPSYINGPPDADQYFYPYKPEPGMPRMSVIGNVPLYMDEKRGFEDLKV